MTITRQADYAVRAVLYLCQHGPTARIVTSEIGREQHIPVTFLAKIIAQLSAAGVVRSTRGAHGGVTLGRAPESISLLDIVEIIDGPLLLNDCVGNADTCPSSVNCPVHDIWCEAQAELVKRLAATTFAQLVQERQLIPAGAAPNVVTVA
ncbi:MAG: Rrf2 family transcriptional regulator [Anaerolineales bacterium]|nr:Rrf2 family transcriptional regulator [Anaerolineales bacterium]